MGMNNGRVRAAKTPVSLTAADAAIVKGMLARGDRQHDIAAWFGVNGGRIADIKTKKKFANVAPIYEKLPPSGPYIAIRSVQTAKAAIEETIDDLLTIAMKLESKLALLN